MEAPTNVSVAERPQDPTASLVPAPYGRIPGSGGGPGDVSFAHSCVDDDVLIGVQGFKDGAGCQRATQFLAVRPLQVAWYPGSPGFLCAVAFEDIRVELDH